MKSKILGTVAALFLMVSSCSCVADGMTNNALLKGQIAAAWQMACEAKKVDCTLIEEPIVGFTTLGVNTLGMYPGVGPIVLVNIDLEFKPSSVPVIVHEMTHYIQQLQIEYLGVHMSRCERERESYTITREMAIKYKLDVSAGGTEPWEKMFWIAGCSA